MADSWWEQLASVISGESPSNSRNRQEARDRLDKYDREQEALRQNNKREGEGI